MVYAPAVSVRGASSGASDSRSYERERELLFNMIFRLQSEIDSLRQRLDATPTVIDHPEAEVVEIPRTLVRVTDIPREIVDISAPSAPTVTAVDPQPAMTLEDTERETIRRSLEKNAGRRKATARELNISERTLYRKIKEYGLE